jgi:hypothetical protein
MPKAKPSRRQHCPNCGKRTVTTALVEWRAENQLRKQLTCSACGWWSIPSLNITEPHKHRCMRCGEEFNCQTPGRCEARYDVLPSIVTMGPNGPVVTQHCDVKQTSAPIVPPEGR